MKRRWFAVIGSAIVLVAGYLAGGGTGSARATLPVGLLGLAGVLILLSGYDPVPERFPWNRLLGVGLVILGATFLVLWVVPVLEGARSTTAIVLGATGLVNATLLGLVGVDWFLGGVFFDLSSIEPGPLFAREDA